MNGPDFAKMFRGYLVAVEQELSSLPAEQERTSKAGKRSKKPEIFPHRLRYGRFDPRKTPQRVEELAAQGNPNHSIAEALRVDEWTLAAWCNLYPALRHAIERGREGFRSMMPAPQRPCCPRCGGWVDTVMEFVEESSMERCIPRCLMCGKRYYRGVTVVTTRKRRSHR